MIPQQAQPQSPPQPVHSPIPMPEPAPQPQADASFLQSQPQLQQQQPADPAAAVGVQLGSPVAGAAADSGPAEVMTSKEAAEFLKIDESEVISLLTQGLLAGKQMMSGWRVTKKACLQYLDS